MKNLILFLLLHLKCIDSFVSKINIKVSPKLYSNLSPSEIVYKNLKENTLGLPWTYKDLVENARNHNIDSASIIEKNNHIEGFVTIDKLYKNVIEPVNLHPIQSDVTELSSKIIEILDKNKINFDVLNIPESVNLLQYFTLPLQFIGIYLLVVLGVNLLRMNQMGNGMVPMNILKNDNQVMD